MNGPKFEELLASHKSENLASLPRFLIFGLITNRTLVPNYHPVDGTFVVAEENFGARYPIMIFRATVFFSLQFRRRGFGNNLCPNANVLGQG